MNLHLVLGLAHFDTTADPGNRNRVTVAVQRDVAFQINGPLMQPVDFRNPDGQRLELRLLDGEQFTRDGVQMFLITAVDAITPLASLLVEIRPTGETAAGEEVGFYKPEGLMRSCA